MEGDDRLRRASWFNPRLRRYTIKERPISWVFGNYRKTADQENTTAERQNRKSMPPVPPVRSPLTRLQSDPSMVQMEVSSRNKDSEKDLRDEIRNGSNGSERSEAGFSNVNEIRNAPVQEKDLTIEI